MSAGFAARFAEFVVPDLEKACHVSGLLLASGLRSYSESVDEVMAVAIRRGAHHLPEKALAELEDWIGEAVMQSYAEYAEVTEAITPAGVASVWRTLLVQSVTDMASRTRALRGNRADVATLRACAAEMGGALHCLRECRPLTEHLERWDALLGRMTAAADDAR